MMSNKSSNDSTPTRYTTSSIPTTSSVKDPTKTDPYIPVYIILPFLIGICIAIAVYFGLRRKKKDSANINEKKMPNGIIEEQEQQTVMLLSRSPTVSKKYTPIPVPSLEHEVRKRSADEGKLFREEFNSLPTGIPEACCEAANREENKVKNRYPNILPGDNSRVTLTSVDGVAGSDYINASYVDGYKVKNKFIAAQGPKQETVSDFWRMIWEQKSATIVMLTNLKEKKEEKCFKYWPDQGLWTYGTIRVSVEDVTVLVDYTIRKFSIQNLQQTGGPKAPRFITQLHFTSWPDFGVPFAPVGMLKFLKKVKTVNPSFSGPIIVHCSAGVGRTGTFIVIDAMIDMMQEEQKVDVFSFVSRIRKQRSHLVQTDIQYSFIYQALLEHFLYGDTELDVSSLEKHIQKLHSKSDNSDITGLEEEFNKLTTVRIRKDHMRTGNKPVNLKKARVLQIIPYDFNRVVLPRKRGQEYSDYVNASYIDGYRQKHYFIATQGPLSITVEDFWKMIWDNKSHTIVMLTELREREQEKCFQYWPSENTVTFENYTIELKTDNLSDAFSVRDFLLTNISEGRKNRLIRQFHFHDWPEIGIPAEGRGMIDLIAAVQKQQQQTGNQPIIVHCSAGAGRTGTFIALSNILERVKAEGLLDVFQTVKSLRMQRPHMVQTVEQYDFCYKVVQDYLDIHSDYANFK